MNNPAPDRPGQHEAIEATAAAWLARRDRGFERDEAAEFALWRYSDPRHAAAMDRLDEAYVALDQLRDYRPHAVAHPDENLLVPGERGRGRHVPLWAGALAAAAALAVALHFWSSSTTPPGALARRQAIVHPGPERVTLDDGSIVELNTGAKIDVHFSRVSRRVSLLGGEAHFNVAHDVERPFVVDMGHVVVRVIGTAFSVSHDATEVAVLVTEGRVQVARPAGPDAPALAYVSAGQRAVVNWSANPQGEVAVQDVTPAQRERLLSWQAMRLEFVDIPLRDVVTEFNRYNQQKMTLADEATGSIVVAGSFRADNVDGFVRLVEMSFGVSAFRHGNDFILRKTP